MKKDRIFLMVSLAVSALLIFMAVSHFNEVIADNIYEDGYCDGYGEGYEAGLFEADSCDSDACLWERYHDCSMYGLPDYAKEFCEAESKLQ